MKSGRDQVTQDFHFMLNTAMASSTFGLLASPNTNVSPRMLAEADTWAHYRFEALRFRLHRVASTTGVQAVGYVGGVQDVTPATVPAVSELLPSTFLSTQATVPSDWVRVPKKDLAGPLPWYKTIPGGADSTEEAPGVICVSTTGGATDSFSLEIRGRITFKTAVATGNTPIAIKARQLLREERITAERSLARDAILRVIGSPPVASAGKQ